ncbi:hypothetical protein STXM2123_4104 [Streptomyces sp. F-3]|nr:hypothetical protein STXM2123_4104 [Streptomyces sp. F-3]
MTTLEAAEWLADSVAADAGRAAPPVIRAAEAKTIARRNPRRLEVVSLRVRALRIMCFSFWIF